VAEIHYAELPSLLKRLRSPGGAPDPVYLLHGEAMLVKLAFDELLQALLPDGPAGLGYEPIDGAAGVGDVVAAVGTYALLGGTKVVAYRDARLFHTREDAGRLLTNARTAWAEGDRTRARRDLTAALAQMGCRPEDFKGPARAERLPPDFDPGEDDAWLDALLELAAGAREDGPAADASDLLERTVAAGLPPGHHLVITTDLVDRRRTLYAAIAAAGTVVDCSVPRGERRADKEAQQAVLAELVQNRLRPQGKRMNPAAFAALCETTGFEPGVFANNLDLLIAYVGERREITPEDVAAALARTRKDPIFELTNAVTDRELELSLRVLGSLLADMHALQALAALVNQVRRLLVAREFLESPEGSAWQTGCPFPRFQQTVVPALVRWDQALLARIDAWDGPADDTAPAAGRKKKAKPKSATDLVLAKNPANAYPLYHLIKKAERFTPADLRRALDALYEADHRLKSSAANPRLVLERAVRTICTPAAPVARETPGGRRRV
jgi:DNA polymerase-3 subunit delta